MNNNLTHHARANSPRNTLWRDTFGLTHRGPTRTTNEDQFLVGILRRQMSVPLTSLDEVETPPLADPAHEGVLMAVADGVAGNGHGEQASAAVLQALCGQIAEEVPWTPEAGDEPQAAFVRRMKKALYRCRAQLDEAGKEMGNDNLATTLTVVCVFWPHLYLFHVGDSRCYRIRGEQIQQLTTDHTVAQQFADKGIAPRDSAESTRLSKVLWNSVHAGSDRVEFEIGRFRLEPGDSVLVCSDGLFHALDDRRIHALVQESETAQGACKRLIEGANRADGSDNVTAVLSRFRSTAASRAGHRNDSPERLEASLVDRVKQTVEHSTELLSHNA